MTRAHDTLSVEPTSDEVTNAVVDESARLGIRRYFTIAGRDPFDEIEWETRDAFIPGKDKPVFEQKDVEFPKFWSQTATNIVSQKYFRGRMTSPERERSVRQMIGRVVDTISAWGRKDGYFATDEEADTFEAELKARVLESAGYDMSLDSPDWASIQYQNANNSVRVTDAFMEAVDADADWNLTARTDGTVVDTVKARKLLKDMAEAAWQCADQGV